MNESDAALKERVEEVFKHTSRVDWHEVQVSVADAVVKLSGTVDSAREKRTARQLAEDIPGVQYVDDQLQIKDFVKRPDNELAEEVRHRILRDAYTEDVKIEVYASDGQVRLDGSVPTYRAKKDVEEVVWWTPGVTDVESLLLVTDEDFVDVSPGQVVDV